MNIGNYFSSTETDKNARALLGCELKRSINDSIIRAKIIEVEAYDQNDQSSHSYRGVTMRNKAMFGAPAHAYIYLSYGLHYCLNIVTGPVGFGAGVLIRAVKIIDGLDLVRQNRGQSIKTSMLSNGPGKVGQALGINLDLYGHDLTKQPLKLIMNQPIKSDLVVASKRIGISRNRDALRRFTINN